MKNDKKGKIKPIPPPFFLILNKFQFKFNIKNKIVKFVEYIK